MTGKIFISHASQEHDLAEHIANYLESRKEYDFKAWYAPRDIRAGYDYDQEILNGIEQCRVFVLLLSAHSDASVHVKRELYDAVENGKRVICLEVERINPQNLRYLLGMKHRLNWLERRDETLDELIRNILDEIDQDKNFYDDTEDVKSSEISQVPEVSQTHYEVKVNVSDKNFHEVSEIQETSQAHEKAEGNASGKIFLSYTNSRRKSAVKIAEYLERSGLETWYPSRDISAGVNHAEAVTSALRECRAVVLLLSKEADNNTSVENEIAAAVSNNKPVYCVRFDKFEPEKLKSFLGTSRVFDTRKNYDEAINELVRALKGENEPEPPKPRKFSLKKFLGIAAGIIIAVTCVLVLVHEEPKVYDVFYLAENGTPAEIQEAIDAGANFNVNNLHVLKNKNPESLRLLLMQFSDEVRKKFLNESIFWAARHITNPEIIKVLVDMGADLRLYSFDGNKIPIFEAAKYNNNPDVLKIFLDKESSTRRKMLLNGTIHCVNEKGVDGLTLLGCAAIWFEGRPKTTKYLIDIGADVNTLDFEGNTILMQKLSGLVFNAELIQILVDSGINVNARNKEGKTALMYAVNNPPDPLIEILIKAGAEINTQDNEGRTALIHAAKLYPSDVQRKNIKRLLNYGADKNIRDNSGKTAYDYACENEKFDASLLPLLSPDIQPVKEN